MTQFKKLIKIWKIKRSSILPILLTTKTQQTRCWWKKRNNRFFLFFVKICRQKSFHWNIHKKIKQTTTQTVKFIIKINLSLLSIIQDWTTMQHKTKHFHEEPRYLQKTMEETSLSLKTVFDHPIKFSSFLPHRLSAFAVLIQFRWSLKRANKKLKYSSDWKWNLLDFSTKRNRLFNDWWSKRNQTKKRRFSDLSYSHWCRSRLWFGNNPESLLEMENYRLSLGKRNWQRFKCQCFLFLIQYWKTYRGWIYDQYVNNAEAMETRFQ